MRKSHETVLRAFLNGERRKVKNLCTDGQAVYLHDNAIIWRSECGDTGAALYVLTLAGWPTVTTRAVLNAFTWLTNSRVRFYQHDHTQYVDGTISDFDLKTLSRSNLDVDKMEVEPFDCVEVEL